MRLTEAGRLFYPHAVRILGDVAEAEAAMDGLTGVPRGLVRVRAAHAFAQAIVAPMLPDFLDRFPEVQVFLDANDAPNDVSTQWADVVIQRGTIADDASVARALPPVEIWLCASPRYTAAHGVPHAVQDLGAHRLVDREAASTWEFEQDGRSFTFECRPPVIIPDAAAQRELLLRGYGIGRLPAYLARPSIARGDLVRVLPEFAGPTVHITAVYPTHRTLSARVHVFIEVLYAHMTNDNAVPQVT